MLPRATQSSALRVTLLYTLVFALSMGVLLGFIYFAVIREMESQIRVNVSTQLGDLGIRYLRDGAVDTATNIRQRIERDREYLSIYLLMNARGKILAGNIDRWPGEETASGEWIRFPLYRDNKPAHEWPRVLAQVSRLPNGYTLLVGHKLHAVDRVREAMIRVVLIGVPMTIAVALLGGWWLARSIRRRLSSINELCKRVMSGELGQRLHVSEANDEFDELASQFNAMLTRVSELVDGIHAISSNIAHDLRTPLNRLRNRLEALEANPPGTETLQDELQEAQVEIDNLVSTLNAILRISKAEMGAGIEHFTDLDLSLLIADVAELYLPLAEEKNLTLASHVEEGVWLFGDRALLTQAIANLVDNAIKYTQSHGRIEIVLKTVRGRINLWVADNGPGIPPEHYDHVRERFFRLEKSRATPGNGLGLSLADAAFRLHGAELSFSDNHPGLKIHILFAKS